jgi:hypothetical protein
MMSAPHHAISDGARHYQMSTIWIVAGIGWGAISYSYSASIIGTTLGKSKRSSVCKLDSC